MLRTKLSILSFGLAASLLLLSPLPCQAPSDEPEVVSLLGARFYAHNDEKGAIAAARQKVDTEPKNIGNILALGKAYADLWRYKDAIAAYTRGIEIDPDNAMLYRHRGHRYISLRRFREAVKDLEKAARLNDRNFDIWYHLGLAHYLLGDFSRAIRAYQSCLKVVDDTAREGKPQTDDSLVAVADWLYMSYRRAGKTAQAAKLLDRIHTQMNVKENTSYYHRLLFYKGRKKQADLLITENATDLDIATRGYGVANWHYYSGRRQQGRELFEMIVFSKHWPAFGFIAAEVDLAREKGLARR